MLVYLAGVPVPPIVSVSDRVTSGVPRRIRWLAERACHYCGRGSPLNRSCAGQRPAARVGVAGPTPSLTCGFCSVSRRFTPVKWRAQIVVMHVHDAAGRLLNATFSAQPEGNWVALIMESRSGRAAGRPGRNADYNPALTLLLERLARLDATLAVVSPGRFQEDTGPGHSRGGAPVDHRTGPASTGTGHGSASCADGNGAGQDRPGARRNEGR